MLMRISLSLILVFSLVLSGCDSEDEDPVESLPTQIDAGTEPPVDEIPEPEVVPLRSQSQATEYVGVSTEKSLAGLTPDEVFGPLFGTMAAGGTFQTEGFAIQKGLYLRSAADPRTPQQSILTLEMDVSGKDVVPARRTLVQVPASFEYGLLFEDTVSAAMARGDELMAADPNDVEPFRLEYRLRSANGGTLTLGLDFTGEHGARLLVEARTPRTSLLSDEVNTPARVGEPYESIYGLVYFSLTRDNFDFFATRAYGISAGKSQNFADFHLLPHNWLRLTVTPELDKRVIDVAFEVVTTDGRRLQIARAPASMFAGEQFMQTVFRMVDNMEDAEAALPGSSVPWRVPFYYDDPNGGGVVEVIAEGRAGGFRIAYAVESPVNFLQDVDFVAYQGNIDVPDDWDKVDPTCAELGSEPSAQGFLDVTFAASSTVLNSDDAPSPLKGHIWGSVFRAEDVLITGPIEGTKAVASFHFQDVELDGQGAGTQVYRIDTPVQAGDYHILGFMDVDTNADPDNADPDVGDPVMIPIGGYTIECAVQPVTAEFAILLPDGF